MKSIVLVLFVITSFAHASGERTNYSQTKAAFDHAKVPMFNILGQHEGYCFTKQNEDTLMIWGLLDVRSTGSEIKYLPYLMSARHKKGEVVVIAGDPKVELKKQADQFFDTDEKSFSVAKDHSDALVVEHVSKKKLKYFLREGASGNLYLKMGKDGVAYCMFAN